MQKDFYLQYEKKLGSSNEAAPLIANQSGNAGGDTTGHFTSLSSDSDLLGKYELRREKAFFNISDDVSYTEQSYPSAGGLEWKNVNMVLRNSRLGAARQILCDVNGRVEHGQFMGIIGGSGAGKSTLLNILSGRLTSEESTLSKCNPDWAEKLKSPSIEVSGDIGWGKEWMVLGDESDALRSMAGYVLQSDILCTTFTPAEAIRFSARLTLPDLSDAEIEARVAKVIDSLKLNKCQNTLIGDEFIRGISGGEKKRTAVAMELVTEPSLIFLDEPSSGLDSFTAQRTVDMLKDLCKNTSRIIVATLHQPSTSIVFSLDLIFLLAEGNCAYLGPPSQLTDYLSQLGDECAPFTNPADFAMELVQTNPDKYIRAWQRREQSIFIERPINFEGYAPLVIPELQTADLKIQFYELMKRERYSFLRDPRPSRLRGGQSVFFSFLIGVLWWNIPYNQSGLHDRFGFVFYLCIPTAFFGIIYSIVVFPQHRLLVERERDKNMYSALIYLTVNTIVESIASCVFSLIQGVIMYYMAGCNTPFALFYLIMALVANTGGSMGLLCSCFADNVAEALQFLPVTLIPMLVFANFIVSLDQIPSWVRWLQWLDLFRYSVDALCITEFRGQDYKLDSDGDGYSTGDEYLESIGVDKSDLALDLIAMVVLLIVFRLVGCLILMDKLK